MEKIFSQEKNIVTILIISILLLLLMAIAVLLFFFFTRKKIIEKELEKTALALKHQKDMIYATIATQEKERKRIAQDLHDDISSKLNVILLNSNFLIDGELTVEEYTKVNKNIIKVTQKALSSARKIAHDLLPAILEEFGLLSAIEELVDDYNMSKKVIIGFDVEYPMNYLGKTEELHVFRIIQELINNSIRHGEASNILLDFYKKDENIILKYSDNGIGFIEDDDSTKKGLGMKNIESRVELLNGSFTIKSEPNKGVKVVLTM
jgi:two-component system NarL family sensor kinase